MASTGIIEPLELGAVVVATCTLEGLPWKEGNRYKLTGRVHKEMFRGGSAPWRWFYAVDDGKDYFVLPEMFKPAGVAPGVFAMGQTNLAIV